MNELKTMWRIYLGIAAVFVLAVIAMTVSVEGAAAFSFVTYFLAPLFIFLAALFCWPKPLCIIGKSRIVVNHPFCGP